MFRQHVSNPLRTELAAPILFTAKEEGTLRFWVNCWKQNGMTKRDSYFIQTMDECIDILGKPAVISALDTYRGYWHMEIEVSD